MTLVEDAKNAVERSRAQHYLNEWDSATRELAAAIDSLRALETSLRTTPPSDDRRRRLRSALAVFRSELRLAERVHQQAAAWESRWALAIEDTLGRQAAAYKPDGSPASAGAIRHMAWEG